MGDSIFDGLTLKPERPSFMQRDYSNSLPDINSDKFQADFNKYSSSWGSPDNTNGLGVNKFNFLDLGSSGPTPLTWKNKLFNYTDKEGNTHGGALSTGWDMLKGAGNFWLGKQQLDLGEDQLKTSKQQFSDQFNAQKQQVNMDIWNEGKAGYDSNSNNLTPEEYYEKHKIS